MIPRETAEDIIATARVEDVVRDFISLKRRGGYYVGLCPFHSEKTPSFTVTPSKGIFKCFGCGKGGDSVSFVMEHEQFSYPEALRYLAKKYNIEIHEESSTVVDEASGEKEVLYQLYALAQKYYSDFLLNSPEGKAVGLSYFRERGFTDEMIATFQLGYAGDGWDGFSKHALDKGFKPDQLTKAGLSMSKDGKVYDRFRKRVMFPIHSLSGRVIAFGGRIMIKDPNQPKYINSPESDIYIKSKTLYGIHLARKSISMLNNCALVEGYTDVVSLYQSGITNAVASGGTSLTLDQIRLIRRYAESVTILYDGDAAGIKASFRGIDMILEEGLSVRIVLFPDGEDPDSYARNHTPEEITAFLAENATDFIRFKTNLLFSETLNDPIKKAGLIKEIVRSIALVPDPIARSLYTKDCSIMMEVDEKMLIFEVNKIRQEKHQKYFDHQQRQAEQKEVEASATTPGDFLQKISSNEVEEDVIFFLLHFGDKELLFKEKINRHETRETTVFLAELVINELIDDVTFRCEEYRSIFHIYVDYVKKGDIPTYKEILALSKAKVSEYVVDILSSPYALSQNWWEKRKILVKEASANLEISVMKAINSMKLREVIIIREELLKKLKTNPSQEETNEVMAEINELNAIKKEIALKLGVRIIIP
ncbi:MAG: DNA primase [Bacteroidetes bacterium]|nr:DNA primase [Bacteroidota bacterium]MBU1717902.1 DNA primase [Bacteroidota bacterium]